jgi:hypothetical protein
MGVTYQIDSNCSRVHKPSRASAGQINQPLFWSMQYPDHSECLRHILHEDAEFFLYNQVNVEKLIQEVQNLTGLRLTPRQTAAFQLYEQELMDWNSRINLTAIRDEEGVRTKHFLDSLSCLLVMRDKPVHRLIDIGTGAGFPGIPLKIVLPNLQLTLVESVGKKADFCRHIV